MRVKLQLVVCTEDGCEETVADVISLQKDCQRIEQLGLTLAEAKQRRCQLICADAITRYGHNSSENGLYPPKCFYPYNVA